MVWVNTGWGVAPFHEPTRGGHEPAKYEQDTSYRVGAKFHAQRRGGRENGGGRIFFFGVRPNKTKVLNETVVDEVIGVFVLRGAIAFCGGHGGFLGQSLLIRLIITIGNMNLTA